MDFFFSSFFLFEPQKKEALFPNTFAFYKKNERLGGRKKGGGVRAVKGFKGNPGEEEGGN